ncbi:LysR family transcriptional regulator [Rouxiella sp. Mn2063]|uniref:LysR family transcriptional regulator n=1 Tax=Rouxiella sp. Mn2063 TaxID=3395262 RepID=UPI003BE90A6C
MKFEDLTAFMAVYRLQSTRVAAEELGLTQPAITRRVQNFEESLGIVLLDRQTKPLKPTLIGKRVFQQCQNILREVDALRDLVADDTPASGLLRLAVPQSLSESSLLPALNALSSHFPQVQPRLSSGWGEELLTRVQQQDLDAAVVLFPASKQFADGVESQALGSVELVVVGPKTAAPPPKHLDQCYQQGWILNPQGCGFRAALQRALTEQGLPLLINLEAFGTSLQLSLIAQGRGMGLMPRALVEQHPLRDQLSLYTLNDFAPHSQLWLIYPPILASQIPAVEVFAEAMAKGLGLESRRVIAINN